MDSSSRCNLVPLNYCKKYGLRVKRESQITQLSGFDGSSKGVEGYLESWVKIGP